MEQFLNVFPSIGSSFGIVAGAMIAEKAMSCTGITKDCMSNLIFLQFSLKYQTAFTTDFSEGNIVFGGEKKLYKAIMNVAQRYHPVAIFVYATCLSALIGDDIDSVCKLATQQINLPVIYVNAPGFLGSKNLGNRIGNETLLNAVIGTAEPEFTTPFDTNIVGDYNVAGETWNILPLFQKMGVRVLSKITGDARYQDRVSASQTLLTR